MFFTHLLLLILALTAASQKIANSSAPGAIGRRQATPIFSNWNLLHFHDTNLRDVTMAGLVDAMSLAENALDALDCSPPPGSFRRYFKDDHLDVVRAVFASVLEERQPTGHRTNVYYGDDPAPTGDTACVDQPGLPAYMYAKRAGFDGVEIFLCPILFAGYLKFRLSDITCDELQPYATEVMKTVGGTILHEMLHGPGPGAAANLTPGRLEDIHIDYTGIKVSAYGAFYAHYLNTDPNTIEEADILNVDNFLFFALEVWFQRMCGLPGFQDPVPPAVVEPATPSVGTPPRKDSMLAV